MHGSNISSSIEKNNSPLCYVFSGITDGAFLAGVWHRLSVEERDKLLSNIFLHRSSDVFSFKSGSWTRIGSADSDELLQAVLRIAAEPIAFPVFNSSLMGVFNEKTNVIAICERHKRESPAFPIFLRSAYLASSFFFLPNREIKEFRQLIQRVMSAVPVQVGTKAAEMCGNGEKAVELFFSQVAKKLAQHGFEESAESVMAVLHFWLAVYPSWIALPEEQRGPLPLDACLSLFATIGSMYIPALLWPFYAKLFSEEEIKRLYFPRPTKEDLDEVLNLLNEKQLNWASLLPSRL